MAKASPSSNDGDGVMPNDFDSLKLSEEQVIELGEVFALIDKNGDGTISTKELREAVGLLGQNPTDDELHETINEFLEHFNRGKRIDLITFMMMMSKISTNAEAKEDSLRQAFLVFDKDSTGYVAVEELRQVLNGIREIEPSINQAAVDEMLTTLDQDNNSRIDWQEFMKMVYPDDEML